MLAIQVGSLKGPFCYLFKQWAMPSKSPGPDHIPTRLLKLLAVEIAPCLKLLFSGSLHQGKVPLEWKKALVCPSPPGDFDGSSSLRSLTTDVRDIKFDSRNVGKRICTHAYLAKLNHHP